MLFTTIGPFSIPNFDHLSYIQWFYRRPHSRLRKFLMSVGSFLPKGLMTATFFTKVEYFFSRPSRKFLHYIHRYQPSLLVTATPGFTNLEAEVIMFARRLGIPTAAVNLNYDNLTSNLKMIRKTDYLSVWNSRMEGEALRLHRYPRGRVFIIGCLRFDHYFQEEIPLMDRTSFILSKGLDPKKKLILFVTPTPSNYPMQKDLAKTIIDLKRSGRFTGDPDILIRLHPITPLDLYQEFLSLPGLRIERAGRQVLPDKAGGQKVEMDEDDLTNLKCSLKYADVVVNFASTMIIEASIFDRPIINIAFPRERAIVYEYEYNKALVDTKAVVMSFSPDELAGQINTYLQHPEKDREARQNLVKEYIPYADGLSWKRSISFIQTIIS